MRLTELFEYEAYDDYWIGDETDKVHSQTTQMAKSFAQHDKYDSDEQYDTMVERLKSFIDMAQAHRDNESREGFMELRQQFIRAHQQKDWQKASQAAFEAFQRYHHMTGKRDVDYMFASKGKNG